MQPRSSASTFFVILVALALGVHEIPRIQPATLHATSVDDLPVGVAVSDSVEIRDITTAGEVQSTVVPPGKKWACPYGRLLISNDDVKTPGQVALLSLDALGANPTFVMPELPPGMFRDGSGNRRILSNDHDLVALTNGDVLLVKMGQTKAHLSDNRAGVDPLWYDHTYKFTFDQNGNLTEAWGPGARSEMFVWRSENCGDSFTFVSAIDTATLDDAYGSADDGSAALPQPLSNGGWMTGPGDLQQPAWQMGGTDGPLVRVDPIDGRIYITMGLVGRKPVSWDPNVPFILSTAPLDRTVVMVSSDQGSTWTPGPILPYKAWRLDVVPRWNGFLAFGHQGWIEGDSGYAFVNPVVPPVPAPYFPLFSWTAPEKPGTWGWNQLPWTHPVLYKYNDQTKDTTDKMQTNFHGQPVLTRSPSSLHLVFAYLDTIPGAGDGYRVYGFDGQEGWQQFPDIAPKSSNPDDFVLHLTAVDPRRGPLMYYWYDVDTVTKTATIRARLHAEDDASTVDFTVSRTGQTSTSFDVLNDVWYGDYHTAGAYYVSSGQGWKHDSYHYFPIWLQDDGKLRVAHVTFQSPLANPGIGVIAEVAGYVAPAPRLFLRQEIDVTRLLQLGSDEEEVRREPSR